MVVACAGDGGTYGCRSLVEGILVMSLLFEVMGSVPPSQPTILGGLALGMPLWKCLVDHPVISRWCRSHLAASAWLLLHGLLR
jgi:hypothetical protein